MRTPIQSGALTLILMWLVSGCYKGSGKENESPSTSDDVTVGNDSDSEDPGNAPTSTDSAIEDEYTTESGGDDTGVQGPLAEMSWAVVEPGTFLMGSPTTEWGRFENEYLHEVSHSHRYEMAVTEVTCAEWRAMDTGLEDPCDPTACTDLVWCPAVCAGDDCPVSFVTVEMAKVWLDALSVSAGLAPCYEDGASWPTPMHCPGYRIPTESEWERAARAGDPRATYNGDFNRASVGSMDAIPPVLESIAWCGRDGITEEERKPRPVASGAPNALGLYDMIGNLGEITLWEGVYPDETVQNSYADSDGAFFAVRGGNYNAYVGDFRGCRAASRSVNFARYINGGLRPVRTLPGGDLPEPRPADPCPSSGLFEQCAFEESEPPPLYRPASDGERYVDIAHNDAHVMLLGVSDTAGPFIEVLDFGLGHDNEVFVRHSLAQPTSELRPVTFAIETIADETPRRAVAVLCDENCALYELPELDSSKEAIISPMDNGAVPSWLGEITDVVFLGPSMQIFLAGDGIARFDGTDWHEEVAPSGGRFRSLDAHTISAEFAGKDGYYVAAAGENGHLVLFDIDHWRTLDAQTNADLSDVVVYLDDTYTPGVMAVGEDGTVVDTSIDGMIACQVGDADFTVAVREFYSSTGAYDILNEDARHFYEHDMRNSVRTCMKSPPPADLIDVAFFYCGINKNRFYLTKTGLFGEGVLCLIP
jgi:formylglycine-generating enzyme required for sulfatase activity